MNIEENYILTCNERRKQVERALTITLTATEGQNELFMNALEYYISGEITLEDLEQNVDNFKYL